MADITPNDIEAMGDVLALVNEESDSLSVEDAVELLRAVQHLGSQARTTIGLLSQQMVGTLESPRVFGGTLYEVVNDGTWRPDHGTIKGAVKREAAVDTETGEVRTGAEAAEAAMEIMYDLFVSPSTFPKTGGLDRLGLDKGDAGHFEMKGKKLRETKVVESD